MGADRAGHEAWHEPAADDGYPLPEFSSRASWASASRSSSLPTNCRFESCPIRGARPPICSVRGHGRRLGVSELIVVRHGETEWSRSGRHTGRTDVRLTARGEAQARLLGPLLGRRLVPHTLVSPAIRAWRTAQLAGLDGAATDPNLWEWDYGGYEGRTTAEIRLEAWLVSVDRRGDPRRRRASRRVGGGGGCSG
jgi:hypothetical protein